jgi:hypothetical protein
MSEERRKARESSLAERERTEGISPSTSHDVLRDRIQDLMVKNAELSRRLETLLEGDGVVAAMALLSAITSGRMDEEAAIDWHDRIGDAITGADADELAEPKAGEK